MINNRFPAGWNEQRVKAVIDHYENQTEDQAVVEDETIELKLEQTTMQIPNHLVSKVRELIAKDKSK